MHSSGRPYGNGSLKWFGQCPIPRRARIQDRQPEVAKTSLWRDKPADRGCNPGTGCRNVSHRGVPSVHRSGTSHYLVRDRKRRYPFSGMLIRPMWFDNPHDFGIHERNPGRNPGRTHTTVSTRLHAAAAHPCAVARKGRASCFNSCAGAARAQAPRTVALLASADLLAVVG